MIIDLIDYLKDKKHIYVSDNTHNYGNYLCFTDDHLDGFLFNIEVGGKLIIELIRNYNGTLFGGYYIVAWNLEYDSFIYEKDNIISFDLKSELIKSIEYCERYLNLIVFA